MRAIVTGMIASYPVGGVLWDYGQYLLGMERLGFEVFYLEDTGWKGYDPSQGDYSGDPRYGVEFLQRSLKMLSPTLENRWYFRDMRGNGYGLSASRLSEILRTADVFINVSGGTLMRDDYLGCKRRVLIDTDPGWNHFRNYPKWDAAPKWDGTHGFRAHDFFFTYAERIGKPGCVLPELGLTWQPSRPPVVMDYWKAEPPGEIWTTVMTWKTWTGFQETVEHKGVAYGTKEMEFGKVEQLPARARAKFEVAVGGNGAPRERWRELGWSVVESQDVSRTAEDYRHYLQRSRGELSVAKNVYVATGSGWFSCRSVCYLAAGLPVVVQDTGFSAIIPTGEGLFSFTNFDEAAAGIAEVEANYSRHSRAARDVARTHFASEVVLGDLLRRIGL